ncbi:MAG: ABC transporter permease [Rhodothermales bacterium]|nr:ABC transporter permease [Rhodothermales bacterium]MBO6781137.1 ABC transporter permease [Rhodothermales bacterium]
MNLFRLSVSYMRQRTLATLLNVVVLALGVATIVVLLIVSTQVRDNLSRNSTGIDLVVGAKGSPLQLILSAVYHIDAPAGNIPIDEAQRVMNDRGVELAIPMALGDSYEGFRLVGSTLDYPAHYEATPAEGRFWEAEEEATIGARVAAQTGLAVGDTFESLHGLSGEGEEHENAPIEVVGILAETGTVMDQLILTSIETIWHVHGIEGHEHAAEAAEHDAGHEGHDAENAPAAESSRTSRPGPGGPRSPEAPEPEYTALLIQYSSPMAAAAFPRWVNTETDLQAAAPAYETARLFNLLGVGFDALRIFGMVLVLAALLSVFVALINALKERRYDLAMMRSLGASRTRLMAHVLLEGQLLAGMGALLGLAVGHAAAVMLASAFEESRGMAIDGSTFVPGEGMVVLLILGAGLVASLIPAIQAYRTDISSVLADT